MDYVTGALDMTKLFISLLEQTTSEPATTEAVEVTNPQPPTAPASELGLGVKITRKLTKGGLLTIADVDVSTTEQLLDLRNFGLGSLKETSLALQRAGYQPKPLPNLPKN